MRKICFLDYNMAVTGGVESVTASLANELCKYEKVYVASICPAGGRLAYPLDCRIHYVEFLKQEGRLREMMQKLFKPLKAFLKEEKMDAVILMGNYPAFIAAPVHPFAQTKFIYCDHGALLNQWHQKDITLIRYINTLFSDKVVTLTEKTKEDYIRCFHLKPSKVTCIYNWISKEVKADAGPYRLDSKKILSVGRMSYEKGYDLLLKVAWLILPAHPDWQWEIYGDGEEFDKIKKQIGEMALENQVILKGNVKDAYKYYKEYALLVLTSYREGLPLVLLEAKENNIPCVSFNMDTGPSEIIQDGINGYLVKPYDIEEMARYLTKLMEDAVLRRKLSEGCTVGKEKFNQSTILNQWRELISGLPPVKMP